MRVQNHGRHQSGDILLFVVAPLGYIKIEANVYMYTYTIL